MQLKHLQKGKPVSGVDRRKNSLLITLIAAPSMTARILTFIYLLASFCVTVAISPFIKDLSSALVVSLIICGLVLMYVILVISSSTQR
jgi:hypothetical protein